MTKTTLKRASQLIQCVDRSAEFLSVGVCLCGDDRGKIKSKELFDALNSFLASKLGARRDSKTGAVVAFGANSEFAANVSDGELLKLDFRCDLTKFSDSTVETPVAETSVETPVDEYVDEYEYAGEYEE